MTTSKNATMTGKTTVEDGTTENGTMTIETTENGTVAGKKWSTNNSWTVGKNWSSSDSLDNLGKTWLDVSVNLGTNWGQVTLLGVVGGGSWNGGNNWGSNNLGNDGTVTDQGGWDGNSRGDKSGKNEELHG